MGVFKLTLKTQVLAPEELTSAAHKITKWIIFLPLSIQT